MVIAAIRMYSEARAARSSAMADIGGVQWKVGRDVGELSSSKYINGGKGRERWVSRAEKNWQGLPVTLFYNIRAWELSSIWLVDKYASRSRFVSEAREGGEWAGILNIKL